MLPRAGTAAGRRTAGYSERRTSTTSISVPHPLSSLRCCSCRVFKLSRAVYLEIPLCASTSSIASRHASTARICAVVLRASRRTRRVCHGVFCFVVSYPYSRVPFSYGCRSIRATRYAIRMLWCSLRRRDTPFSFVRVFLPIAMISSH